MIAQVMSVNLQATKVAKNGKSWAGYEIVYQGQPYQGQAKPPTTRFLFKNSPIAGAVEEVSVGDWIEMKFDDTQYKNPESMVVVPNPNGGGSSPQQQASTKPQAQSGGGGAVDWDLKDKKISRAVAFKGASEVVSAMIGVEGAFPKASLKKPEFFVEQVVSMAKQFEPYVTMTEDVEVTSETSSDDAGFDQEGFED